MHAWDDRGYKVVVEKYPLPVAIRPFLCPCLRISPVRSAWYHYIPPLAFFSPWPRSPPLALNAYRARGTPLPFVFLIREEETARRGSHLCASRPPHRHTCAVARARARARGGGRAAAGARHEALEKRRCPRMYFLIIDFNDEGSRCQRHLGCWAE